MNNMPKKVKSYGLIWFTKKQYIITQSCVFVTAIAFVYWAIFGNFNELLFGYGNIMLAIAIIGETVETVMMLRAFDKDK